MDTYTHKCACPHMIDVKPHPYNAQWQTAAHHTVPCVRCCHSTTNGLFQYQRRFVPTSFHPKKEKRCYCAHPLKAAPTVQQNACMHITDSLRATVPTPTQAKGAGPAHARQGVEELLKCYGKRLDHEHALTLPMEFLHEPKCVNWLMANRCAGLSPVSRQRARRTIDGHHST